MLPLKSQSVLGLVMMDFDCTMSFICMCVYFLSHISLEERLKAMEEWYIFTKCNF